MQFLKDTDCLSALLGDSTAPDNSLPLSRLLASLLLKDPIKGLEAIEKSTLEVVPFLSQNARMNRDRESDLESDPVRLQSQNEYLNVIEQLSSHHRSSNSESSGEDEEEPDLLNIFSFFSSTTSKSVVPNFVSDLNLWCMLW